MSWRTALARRQEPSIGGASNPRNAVSSGTMTPGNGIWEAFTGEINSQGAPSEASALAISAVFGCVSLIAGAISALPMHIYRRATDGNLTRDENADLWWTLNEQFGPRWPAAAGWSFLVGSKLLHGDAFAEIMRGPGGRIVGLSPLHPERIRVVATPDGQRLVYEVHPDPTIESPSPEASRIRVLDQDDVLHVPGFGFNGLRGLSPLRHALRVTGRLAINAQDFASTFLKNMARPDYALKTAGTLTAQQIADLRMQLEDYRGPMNGGKPFILTGGLDIATLTMPMKDMQLLELRRFQVEEIARIYGVPPFMIGHTEKTTSWGSGVEQMGVGFVRFTLRDHLNAFQNEINRKFFRTARVVAEFDTTDLERADLKTLMDAYRQALGRAGEKPVMTVEEVRKALRLPTTPIFGTLEPAATTPPAETVV